MLRLSRLQLEPTGAARTLLDGGWWPGATATNLIHAQHLLAVAAAGLAAARADGGLPEQVWETDGAHVHTASQPDPSSVLVG